MDWPRTLDTVAYRLCETKKPSLSIRDVISLVAGEVMSSFYPFVWRVMTHPMRSDHI
jgi:hypothetical protein